MTRWRDRPGKAYNERTRGPAAARPLRAAISCGVRQSWSGWRWHAGAPAPARKETAMRSLRTLLAAAGLAAVASATTMAAPPQYTPEYLLKTFKPILRGVEYESPIDPAAV